MKKVFTIPSEVFFLDTLAEGLWARAQFDAVRLSGMRVLLPTRRACRMLRESFLHLMQGKAMLLPRMQPLGDLDEDELLFADAVVETEIPPAIAPLRRRMLLAQLIQKRDASIPIDQAVHLAEALAKFLDEAQIQRCDFAKLAGLVDQRELAEHWQQTVQFLSILTEEWPKILLAEGCLDPAERRNRVLAAQAAAWQASPPNFPIIAAGSTGSMPATAEFLDVIATLPQGCVVLPALDQAMDATTWQAVDDLHPQHGMKNLLELMKLDRADVALWLKSTPSSQRSALLHEAMRPAAVTDAWRHLQPSMIPLTALEGIARTTFAHPQEEAQAIALMLRQALETPEQKIALVTPDRALAERVISLLGRWRIEANDSAGSSLAEQPIGSFLSGVLAAAEPHAGAVAWLSLLKHPLTACALSTLECRNRARSLELSVWRTEKPETSSWLDDLKTTTSTLSTKWDSEFPLAFWIERHIAIAEKFAATDQADGATHLWRADAGEAAADWLEDLRNAAHHMPPLDGSSYANLFNELLRQASFHPRHNQHPRLSILGPLEARLLRPDFVVLGGMNEGVWPPEVAVDPWMSRPMKKDFGMAPAEYRIGLSAHDFVQLASAPNVIMTRSTRSGGSPTVPSRFLLQIETVLRALGYSNDHTDALQTTEPWQAWAELLDEPDAGTIKPCAAPEPRPPLALRPTKLSVTEIGTWQRNPYAIYAKYILGLRKLDPLEAETDAADRGNLIHQALEKFVHEYPTELPADALPQLLEIGEGLFVAYDDQPEIKAFWWPRFERIAAWFIEKETERRDLGIRPIAVEASGQMMLDEFTLKGRADRIDRVADGTLSILDYKTGGVPTRKDVLAGIEPQLPLLALMAEHGAFKDVKAASASELAYWKLGGGKNEDSNKPAVFNKDLGKLVDEAEVGLRNLVTTFTDPATAYHAVPKPSRSPRFDDYAHLARLAEWGRTEQD